MYYAISSNIVMVLNRNLLKISIKINNINWNEHCNVLFLTIKWIYYNKLETVDNIIDTV